ncbi:hypothetical protein ACJJTC_007537, partial [Scirpophaga incertulas]
MSAVRVRRLARVAPRVRRQGATTCRATHTRRSPAGYSAWGRGPKGPGLLHRTTALSVQKQQSLLPVRQRLQQWSIRRESRSSDVKRALCVCGGCPRRTARAAPGQPHVLQRRTLVARRPVLPRWGRGPKGPAPHRTLHSA